MTKEELEKEATEYAQNLGVKDFIAKPKEIVAYFAYIAGAEPREKRIAKLEANVTYYAERAKSAELQGRDVVLKNKDLEEKLANADYQLEGRDLEIRELKDDVRKLKLLVSSLVYEINQIWDINEMNDDLRRCAEKIDREVQLSKMAEDNRMVISALGFAIVPPKPKLDVKEIKEK